MKCAFMTHGKRKFEKEKMLRIKNQSKKNAHTNIHAINFNDTINRKMFLKYQHKRVMMMTTLILYRTKEELEV